MSRNSIKSSKRTGKGVLAKKIELILFLRVKSPRRRAIVDKRIKGSRKWIRSRKGSLENTQKGHLQQKSMVNIKIKEIKRG